ncbi:DNA-directed RNA polymerase, mitochondrial-like [Antedon mediterranea]|uniref:DNA-directed RNA polymerase, mitochondrial-like n=1 Tax=Antedon mediterranea TaxID=105859 RepID=UPI003AF98778
MKCTPYFMACNRFLGFGRHAFIKHVGSCSLCNIPDNVQNSFHVKVNELQTVLDKRVNQLQHVVNKTNILAISDHRAVDTEAIIRHSTSDKEEFPPVKKKHDVKSKERKIKSKQKTTIKKPRKKIKKDVSTKLGSEIKKLKLNKSLPKCGLKKAKQITKKKLKLLENKPEVSSTGAINKTETNEINTQSKKKEAFAKKKHFNSTSLQFSKEDINSSGQITNESQISSKRSQVIECELNADELDDSTITTPETKVISMHKKKHLPQAEIMPLYKTYFTHPHIYLLPYLEVCIFTGMLTRAELMFQKFKNTIPLDVEVFNVMLHGYAKQGDQSKIRKLFKDMMEVGVHPDLQSYAAVLEYIGRNDSTTSKNSTLKYISQMKKEGLDVNNILSCKLTEDEKGFIVNALEKAGCYEALVQKEYEPQLCTNHLVQEFYSSTIRQEDKLQDSDVFSEKLPLDKDYNTFKKSMVKQVKIEELGYLKVKSVEVDDDISPQIEQKRRILKAHEREWQSCLSRAFDEDKFGHNIKSFSGIANFYPFLCLFDTNEYVDIMLQALHTLATSSEGNARVNLSLELGQRIYHRYVILKKIKTGVSKKIDQLYTRFVPLCLNEEKLTSTNLREKWLEIQHCHASGTSLDTESNHWSRAVILSIGSLLADMMLHEINIDTHLGSASVRQMIPGLYHIFDYRSLKTVGFVKPHPKLVSLIQDACLPDVTFDSNQVPMLSPPLPWCSHKFGGYLFSPCSLMRTRDDSPQMQLLKEKLESAALNPVLDSLNQLSNTPWIVNNPVLDIVLDIFRKGGDEDLNIPPPSSVCPEPPSYSKCMKSEEMIEIQKQRIQYRKKKSEMHALRMNEVYKLSIANAFRDHIFWFPHNMDFRGRVYPYPPHFNHLGNDVTRSLLLFAVGKPLGEHGLDWLKIHIVNLTGLKKRASQMERLEFANSMMPLILDSAHYPLEGKKWWQTVDNCWQTLAACKELAAAVSSPDHTKHICHLPVHQDGSCNGLQHYAALGRDVIGAKQVNLYPLDLPQDVYNGVAQMVEESRREDAADGHAVAILLEDKIHRKVVKQTVMTIVYGVTAYGGRLQILKQLKEVKELTFDQQWAASAYITGKVFQSLRKMFTKTRQIQDWLTESAWMIAKAGELVQWETPLGLPIVQPYLKKVSGKVKKSSKDLDALMSRHKSDTMKQKNAFPPNFIHSLDSSHMMLTSLYCQRAGITFSSVHDCFWTHPNTVDIMNQICRHQFVKLHSEPILDDLGKSLITKFGNLPIPSSSKGDHDKVNMSELKDFIEKIPSKGEFDLNSIIKSTYFFS